MVGLADSWQDLEMKYFPLIEFKQILEDPCLVSITMLLNGDNSPLELTASHSFITTKIQIITKYATQNL